jgi:hypothetical protein
MNKKSRLSYAAGRQNGGWAMTAADCTAPSNRKEEGMKIKIGVLAVAASIAITMAWSGTVLAGDKAPERGSWEYQAAMETGSLPAGSIDAGKAAKDSADKPPLVEIGGIVYRIGIDTH